jgi:hypothetical protein
MIRLAGFDVASYNPDNQHNCNGFKHLCVPRVCGREQKTLSPWHYGQYGNRTMMKATVMPNTAE